MTVARTVRTMTVPETASGVAPVPPMMSAMSAACRMRYGMANHARGAMRRWLAHFHVTPCSGLIAEVGRLGLKQGFNVQTTEIAGGYATLIVLSRTGVSRGLHENQS